jgi:hypothetical protein
MAERSPGLHKRLLKHLLHRNLDGFRDTCSVKIGRRVLLDLASVEAWVEAHRSYKGEEPED